MVFVTRNKVVYRMGKKKFRTWDEMDEALRNLPEEGYGKEVKFNFQCIKCKRVVGKDWQLRNKIRKDGAVELEGYCKKCIGKYFHITIKNGRNKLSA